ncbi:MAG TPA: 16S rRNA (guanine(966)-N(2))-methyltransferase RsmD [Burkholderiales bacterium]|nr:16S rRNA (guanine(966)-N(2))-methyltransferase RsmD [Burkholderiales bacterium]
MKTNQVRIIGGQWRSRIVRFPDAPSLRPTPDRLRETLFNWLGQDLTGKVCLDLFAGSGALGFEAASRGARQVVMVEQNAAVYRALRETQATLSAGHVEILRADAFGFLKADARCYDVVFLDPPFRLGWLARLVPLLPARLAPEARVYLETEQPVTMPEGFELLKHTRAGQVHGLLIKYLQS